MEKAEVGRVRTEKSRSEKRREEKRREENLGFCSGVAFFGNRNMIEDAPVGDNKKKVATK